MITNFFKSSGKVNYSGKIYENMLLHTLLVLIFLGAYIIFAAHIMDPVYCSGNIEQHVESTINTTQNIISNTNIDSSTTIKETKVTDSRDPD